MNKLYTYPLWTRVLATPNLLKYICGFCLWFIRPTDLAAHWNRNHSRIPTCIFLQQVTRLECGICDACLGIGVDVTWCDNAHALENM